MLSELHYLSWFDKRKNDYKSWK